jgi:hypothetical protein
MSVSYRPPFRYRYRCVTRSLLPLENFICQRLKKQPLRNALTDRHYDSDFLSETGISKYTGPLSYAINVASRFLSARLTYKTLTCNERVTFYACLRVKGKCCQHL